MLVKTSDLTGTALDWATAKANQAAGLVKSDPILEYMHYFKPSTDWSQAGPIIERESIYLIPNENADGWFAHKVGCDSGDYNGPTPLIAAMRCYVASKLGDTVEIPDDPM